MASVYDALYAGVARIFPPSNNSRNTKNFATCKPVMYFSAMKNAPVRISQPIAVTFGVKGLSSSFLELIAKVFSERRANLGFGV